MDSQVKGWLKLNPVFQPGGPKALSHIQPGCHEDFDFCCLLFYCHGRLQPSLPCQVSRLQVGQAVISGQCRTKP
jgi:hypothetical protein